MTDFELLDISGRTIFADVLLRNGSSAITTTDLKDGVDIHWEKNGLKFTGEIKCRPYNSNKYPTAIFEKKKYISLHNHQGELYYIMLFNDGIGYLWRINDLNPTWTKMWLPKTTCDSGKYEKTEREITYLPFSSGFAFHFCDQPNLTENPTT